MEFSLFIQKLKHPAKLSLIWVSAFLVNIITLLSVYYKIHPGNETLALRYNVITGVDLYGRGFNVYQIPLVGLIIFGVNWIFYKTLKDDKNFLSFFAAFTSLLVAIILLLAVWFLTQVN